MRMNIIGLPNKLATEIKPKLKQQLTTQRPPVVEVKALDRDNFKGKVEENCQHILAILADARGKSKLAEFPAKVLRKIENLCRTTKLNVHSKELEYNSQLGKNIQLLNIRKFLIFNFPDKNAFFLSILDSALRSNYANLIVKNLGFHRILNKTPKNGLERRECFNAYSAMLNFIYRSTNSKFLQNFMNPYIAKAVQSEDKDYFENILRGFYKEQKCSSEFSMKTFVDNNDGKYTSIGFLNGKQIEKWSDVDKERSELLLLKQILRDINLYPLKPNVGSINNKIFTPENIQNAVDKLLANVGFAFENSKPIAKSPNAPDYILRAFAPNLKLPNTILFQKLEYYGDAVGNLLTERFLLEKRLPLKSKKAMYTEMKSNKTFAEYFDKLNLRKYVVGANIETMKQKADVFEAFIGALHLSYDENYVFAFLKKIFEEKYQSLSKEIKI